MKLKLIPYSEGEISLTHGSLKYRIWWRMNVARILPSSPRGPNVLESLEELARKRAISTSGEIISRPRTNLSALIAEKLGKRSPQESDAAREAWKALQAPKRRDAPLARPIAVRWVGPKGDPEPNWDDDIPF